VCVFYVSMCLVWLSGLRLWLIVIVIVGSVLVLGLICFAVFVILRKEHFRKRYNVVL
jgi:predicted membrane protein